MVLRTTVGLLICSAGVVGIASVAGCAPARPVVVEREEVIDPYDGYTHTVVVEEAPPPVVVVGPAYYGGWGYGPRYRHWR